MKPSASSSLPRARLLFLALISYEPKQVPASFPLAAYASGSSHGTANFIGPAGAIIASCFYFLIGVGASFLAAATALGYGGALLLVGGRAAVPTRQLLWILTFIMTGACLFSLQPWVLENIGRFRRAPGTITAPAVGWRTFSLGGTPASCST